MMFLGPASVNGEKIRVLLTGLPHHLCITPAEMQPSLLA